LIVCCIAKFQILSSFFLWVAIKNFSPLTHSGTHTIFLSKGTLQHAVQSTTIHIFWEQLTPTVLYPACFSNSESSRQSRFKTRLNLFVIKEYELSLYCIFGLIWFYGAQHHFQQHFRYIMAVSFIGGGNWSTRRNLTDLLQVTDFIT